MQRLVFENVRLCGRSERFNDSPRKGDVVVRLKNDDAELTIQYTRENAPANDGNDARYRIVVEPVAS